MRASEFIAPAMLVSQGVRVHCSCYAGIPGRPSSLLLLCLYPRASEFIAAAMLVSQVTVLSPPKPEPSMEDREFAAAFDKLLIDDLQNRRGEKPKVPNMGIALPMNLKGQLARRKSISEEDEPANFVLMTRGKGSRQQFKDLQIPLSADRAAHIREKQRAEQAEQEELKRLVLDFNQRQEEEVYNGE